MRKAMALLLGTCVALVSAEVVLRLAGWRPWFYSTLDLSEPVMNEPDPVRGWRNRPGRYTVPARIEGGPATHVTILESGARFAGGEAPDGAARPAVLLVGGSYTRGNALSDDETFAWKLQQAHPGLRIVNHGTGGYGSYQSLLTMEAVLPGLAPGHVLYGFIGHHESRNVAPPEWIDMLSRFSRRSHVAVPFATLGDDGRLLRHAPQAYPAWPLREELALVALAERVAAYTGARDRVAQARPVTERLLVEMASLAADHGAGFAVVLLTANAEQRSHYRAFLGKRGIRAVDCVRLVTPDLQVPGEGHPNARLNGLWARCIAERLDDELRALAASPGRTGQAAPGTTRRASARPPKLARIASTG